MQRTAIALDHMRATMCTEDQVEIQASALHTQLTCLGDLAFYDNVILLSTDAFLPLLHWTAENSSKVRKKKTEKEGANLNMYIFFSQKDFMEWHYRNGPNKHKTHGNI